MELRDGLGLKVVGFDDGGRVMSQGKWSASRSWGGQETDSPPEPPEKNAALLTP